jgi:hypothetical protein
MCNISRSFEIKHRTEITDFGSYRPGILYGSFTEEDVSLIFAYCARCDYTAIVADTSSKTIRVDNKMTGRWGWIKKLWACVDPEKEIYAAQFVYGFFEGKKWRSKYCINENFIKLCERAKMAKNESRVDNSNWPYIIYLPELEPDQVREKIAIIRESRMKCSALAH